MRRAPIPLSFEITIDHAWDIAHVVIDFLTSETIESLSLDKREECGSWLGEKGFKKSLLGKLRYRYKALDLEGNIVAVEPGFLHHLPVKKVPEDGLEVRDLWIKPDFEDILRRPELRHFCPLPKGVYFSSRTNTLSPGETLFSLHKPLPYSGELVVVGAHPLLGRWKPEDGLFVDPTIDGGYSFRMPYGVRESEYKFVLITPDKKTIWEDGDNRFFRDDSGAERAKIVSLSVPLFRDVAPPEVHQIRGTAVPLFSLRSEDSFGVGDFADARKFVDWQVDVGQNVLQFLPLYDTRFRDNDLDTYPYSATTTIGLHPLFLEVKKLPYYYDAPAMTRDAWEKEALELNSASKVMYTDVLNLKLEIARYSFRMFLSEHSADEIQSGIKKLFGDLYTPEIANELEGYAHFYSQKKNCPGTHVSEWGAYDPDNLERDEEYFFSLYLQFHLYSQLSELSDYARSKGVLLKGDLPIGVNRDSADVWLHPTLFHPELQAGSPPDAFSASGQNWGFPTYNWEAHRAEDYSWWRRRLDLMGRFFDLLRVDHILGFFRIFSIPTTATSNNDGYYVPSIGYTREEIEDILPYFSEEKSERTLFHPHLFPEKEPSFLALDPHKKERVLYYRDEYFYRRNEKIWTSTALERIAQTLAYAPLIICAEDLGVLPLSVKKVLRDFNILSLEVLRMPKTPGSTFVKPEDIPILSVLTTSTHDISTLREWWIEELNDNERHQIAEAYGGISSSGAVSRALKHVPNLFLILPLQDWLSLAHYNSSIPAKEERINNPTDPNHIWNYRMPGIIQDLPIDF